LKNETLILAAPDFGAIDQLARRPEPAVLWPVGGQSLAAHWLDHAVRLGCKRVVIHAVDRPAAVRSALGEGAYWSLTLEISSQPPPPEAVAMIRLPTDAEVPSPMTASELIDWWFALNRRWLERRESGSVSIDQEREAGGWVGPHAQIHPTARLLAPYWIGAGTTIGPGCQIGPHALIGADCVLEEDVRVDDSLILPRTFLGAHLDVSAKVIAGSTLLDRPTGTRVELRDRFVASSLASDAPAGTWIGRILAALPGRRKQFSRPGRSQPALASR
jgi:hypothetical protein